MGILLYQIGKTSFNYVDEGVTDYTKRIAKYVPFNLVTLPDIKNAKNLSVELFKKKEGEIILSKLKNSDYIILLDERGKQLNSIEFSNFLQEKLQSGKQQLVFIMGGAYGFSEEVYKKADGKISLSRLTFSHQLIRLIFAEQLYRAFTIIKGEPYHH